MTEQRKDSDWLQSQVVELLLNAKAQEAVDHSACAKYADLLWKMLPKSRDLDPADEELAKLRRKLVEGERANDK